MATGKSSTNRRPASKARRIAGSFWRYQRAAPSATPAYQRTKRVRSARNPSPGDPPRRSPRNRERDRTVSAPATRAEQDDPVEGRPERVPEHGFDGVLEGERSSGQDRYQPRLTALLLAGRVDAVLAGHLARHVA